MSQNGKELAVTWLSLGTWFGEISLYDETTGLGLKERLAKRLITLSNNWIGMAKSQINDAAVEQNTAVSFDTLPNHPESYQEEILISQGLLASMFFLLC